MSQQQNRSNLRGCALWIGYALLVFCALLVAPLYAFVGDDLPFVWRVVSIAGLIVGLPVSLVWVPIASYDPSGMPTPTIVFIYHAIGTAVFTLVQLAVVGTTWYLVRRFRRSRAVREG